MLLSYDDKIGIFTPFKNYGTSCHFHFNSHPQLRHWWMAVGPHPIDGAIGPHCCERLTHYGMTYYVLLRHPYDRVRSMWRYHCKVGGHVSFEWFLGRRLEEPHLGPASWLYPYDRIIRVEEIIQGMEAIGVPMDGFPHENRGQGEHELTEEEKGRIYEIHRWDFEVAGYSR